MDVRQTLVADARRMLNRLQSGTITQSASATTLAGSIYSDEALFALEKERVFRRLPLMLAASC